MSVDIIEAVLSEEVNNELISSEAKRRESLSADGNFTIWDVGKLRNKDLRDRVAFARACASDIDREPRLAVEVPIEDISGLDLAR